MNNDGLDKEGWERALKQVLQEKMELREAFIVEELQPYFAINGDTITAKDTLRVRLAEIADYKQRVKEQIIALEEEFWHIISEDDTDKAHEIVKAILKELKL
jgi:hypothetical protein